MKRKINKSYPGSCLGQALKCAGVKYLKTVTGMPTPS